MQEPVIKKYNNVELDSCRFLHLIIASSGLNNPPENQLINYTDSCPTCQAGRRFNSQLKVTRNTMGNKKIDQNQRYGFLVFENDLAEKILKENLTGIEFNPIEIGKDNFNFKLGHITNELPKFSEKSVIKKFELCPSCGRSGHYSNYDKVDELWYNKVVLDNSPCDFYRTWKYFGIWSMGQTLQSIIVSQKVRQFLKQFKFKHLKYEPIYEL
jgi:hypothetical protein